MEAFGLTGADLPTVGIQHARGDADDKYLLTKTRTTPTAAIAAYNVAAFVQNYSEGRLRPIGDSSNSEDSDSAEAVDEEQEEDDDDDYYEDDEYEEQEEAGEEEEEDEEEEETDGDHFKDSAVSSLRKWLMGA